MGHAGVADGFDRELIRKAIHLLVALVPPLASVHLPLTMGLLMAGTLFYTAAEGMRLAGLRVAVVSGLTVAAARPRDTGFVLGPVTLGLGAMLALLLYPLPASAIAIYALAFGDAAASLIGMAFAGWRMPLNRNKTVAGKPGLLCRGVSGHAHTDRRRAPFDRCGHRCHDDRGALGARPRQPAAPRRRRNGRAGSQGAAVVCLSGHAEHRPAHQVGVMHLD
ncbi:hypothetical protein GBAR_LOCUS4711 [Geodia barretti]|uniref:Dolichol kinase n=1 Tax=Geodia barretti TaxID=519541 RepID=A0AA35RA32_GEOBA|nr:hypothetical protein GBAR_LOCUS4711 [Geodia barretti]